MSIWYWMNHDQREGPCSQQELMVLLKKGSLDESTMVWKEGFSEWKSLGNIDELLLPPPIPPTLVANENDNKGVGKKVLKDLSEINFKEEVIPINAINVKQMSKDFIFWSVSILAVLPLFIVTLKNINYQLVGFALFFAFLWGVVFRQFVVKSNPPWRLLILSLFSTGILGIQLLLQFYKILPDFYNQLTSHDHVMVRLAGSIFHTGVTEELCKILPVLFYFYRKKGDADPKHAIMIGIFSGLGFAAFENLSYADRLAYKSLAMGYQSGEAGVVVGALAAQVNVMLRALSLVFLHAIYTGIFSYFIAIAVISKSRVIALFLVGLLVSSTIHGFYNWFHSVQGTLSAAVCAFAFMLFYAYLTKLDQFLTDQS
ncbi:MAG: hypothetical protein CBC00_00210 [Verrucomicrobia bacterium TMED40]|nr:MAG: hypothetical protein CBC00_00210 [Verrucomicrobia bacterium TMED40]